MKRSKFSLSNYKLFSCDMGELVPCGLLEVLPGDTIQQATSALVRAAPLLAPVMHPVHARIHHWYVPFRLIWDEFEDFITGGPDGTSIPTFPHTELGTVAVGGLEDYLGIPPASYGAGVSVSALPFRAYNLIFNEWYRDQDLVASKVISTGSGMDTTTDRDLMNCAWEKDYFTSARPWEQKGPSITIPLGTTAPVLGIGVTDGIIAAGSAASVRATSAAGDMAAGTPSANVAAGNNHIIKTAATGAVGAGNRPQIYADLSNASAISINLLREAMALQRFEEARARFGSRYTEYLRYLGVRSSDARLQRPEYLGGGKQTIQFSEVLQTAEGTDPVGSLKGHGIGAMRSNRYRRFFEEHGLVISLMSVKPRTMYSQSIHRSWFRPTKEDYWQRELQHIGQQEIRNMEVYGPGNNPAGTFGYQDRYDEYRRQESTVAGEFRDSTLDFWHFARSFTAPPALNETFIQCVPTDRTFAVPSQDVLYIMANHSIQARRLVSAAGNSFIF